MRGKPKVYGALGLEFDQNAGQEVRKALNLKPSGKVVIVVEGDQAIIKPLRGNILDIGGTINIGDQEKPIHFRKVREKVRKQVAKGAAEAE